MVAVAFSPDAARAQRLPYSTHDWQLLNPTSQRWSTSWSDVKVPGDGRTYSLGTTWVDHTDEANFTLTFSGVSGTGSTSTIKGPGLSDGLGAIVAVLQVTNAQQGIVWQRFFHGDGGSQLPDVVTSTHGRGIAVFPGATEAETRIVICGETQDQRLPLSTLQGGAESGLQAGNTAGFLAVYDGRGELKWTRLFYGNDHMASTAITDVAIHVDYRGEVPLDVVTYCGLSSNGSFDLTPSTPTATPLTPENPFPPIPWSSPCDLYATGSEVNHPLNTTTQGPDVTVPSGQWDGIVGRLVRRHDGAGPVQRRFHSIVGGYPDNEGLFGIVEKSLDEFAVVGTTMSVPGQRNVFPLSRSEWRGTPICLTGGTYVHGVIAEFDAQLTEIPVSQGGPGPLVLTASTLIGASGPTVQTVARDVLWHGGLYYVVGSTTGQDFTIGVPLDEVLGTPSSSATGYLVATADSSQEFRYARYFPRDHSGQVSGLIGVAGWNEYPDHVSVMGWVEPVLGDPNAGKDLYVCSLFRDEIDPQPVQHFLRVQREHVIQSPSDEIAGALDHNGAYYTFWRNWIPYQYAPMLGDLGGGGLAVDPRGLLTLVGTTRETPALSIGYPVTGGGRPAAQHPNPQPTVMNPRPMDGVRTVIDMSPAGVALSDGTGDPALGWAPVGNGGTSPACALSSFGNQIGGTPPALNRMFLDYEGAPFPGVPVSLLVDRPPPASFVVASSWQVGVPSPTPVYLPDHDVEVWVVPGSAQATIPMAPTGVSTRQVFTGVPPGYSYLVQYVCLLAVPLTGTPCTGTDLTWATTPAMLFAY